jgi:hypothetical protein
VLVPFGITIAAGARACLVTMRRLAVEQPSGKPNPVARQAPAGGIGSEPWFWYLLTAVGVAACSLQTAWHIGLSSHLMLPVAGAVMGGWVALAASLRKQWLLTIGAGIAAGAVCGIVWDFGVHQLLAWSRQTETITWVTPPSPPNATPELVRTVRNSTFVATMATFGPPTGLLSVALSMFLTVGFGGRGFSEHDRERWARLSSQLLIAALLWAAIVFLVLFGPYLLMTMLTISLLYSGIAGTSGLSVVGAGLRFASGGQTGRPEQAGYRDLVARFAPPLFLLGLLVVVSTPVYVMYEINASFNGSEGYGFHNQWPHLLHNLDNLRSWEGGTPTEWTHLGVMMTVLSVAGFAWWFAQSLGHRVGVNRFSLHALYANRITRCFVAAARHDRQPNPETDFDDKDDIQLSKLVRTTTGNPGPVHLVNTALNRRGRNSDRTSDARHSNRSALTERRAESFVMSPLYCGSEATGYRETETFSGEPDLGTAVAVSGAAVSPNMGYHSDPLVRVMLTLFNLRLGAWFKTPRVAEKRNDEHRHWSYNPAAASKLLWRELFGRVETVEDEIYLSDGGHFENSGVYELLRRRCRFIVAVDAGADPQFQENIGRLVRLARIDFGVEIELDPTIVTPDAQNRTNTHMLVGRIHYDGVQATRARRNPTFDPQAKTGGGPAQGVIVWFKNALTGDESGDVKHYAATHPAFPYESTTDQFFSESQFESYRALGLHTIRATLGRIPEMEHPVATAKPLSEAIQLEVTAARTKFWFETKPLQEVFATIHNNWLRLPHGAVKIYVEGNGEYARILEQLRQEPLLARLYEQVYGAAAAPLPEPPPEQAPPEQVLLRSEETAIGQMFALLEGVWMALELDQNEHHPIYSGWMQLFDHWLSADRVQRFWAIGPHKGSKPRMQAEFSQAFRNFVERRHASRT